MSTHIKPELNKSQDLGSSQQQQQQQRIQLPHRQGHVTLPQGHVHLDPNESSPDTIRTTTNTSTNPAAATPTAGAGQRLLTARERDALIEDLKLEVETRVRKLRSHHELAACALRTKIEMRINRVPRRYWDMTLRELQQLPRGGANSPRKPGPGDGARVTKTASTGSTKPKPGSSSGSGNAGAKSGASTAATAAAAIRRTGRAAATGARHGTALSSEAAASRRGLTRSLRSRGN